MSSENAGRTAAQEATEARGERKVRQGVVVSDGMDKTVVVEVRRRTTHPLYGKTITRSSRLHAHDETNDVHVGDRVRVVETRPLSKTKRWRVVDVIERAK
jgi:small subunit ribosomal protein S17